MQLILDVTFHLNQNCQRCFQRQKEEINVIVYGIKFTKHSRALVSSSTIELVLQLFSSFQLKQHNIMACVHISSLERMLSFLIRLGMSSICYPFYLLYMNTYCWKIIEIINTPEFILLVVSSARRIQNMNDMTNLYYKLWDDSY